MYINLVIFKPGVCQPLAGVYLVYWNYLCPGSLYGCLCVYPSPKAINRGKPEQTPHLSVEHVYVGGSREHGV